MKKIEEFYEIWEMREGHLVDWNSTYTVMRFAEDYHKWMLEQANADPKKMEGFDEFWEKYHTVTKKPKTDLEAAKRYWRKLTKEEKEQATTYILKFYLSFDDKKYVNKARTYLSDKLFLNEFRLIGEQSFSVGTDKTIDELR